MPSNACPTSSEKDFSPVAARQSSVIEIRLTSGAASGSPLSGKLLASQTGSVRLAGGGVDRSAGTGHVGRRRQAAAGDRALVVLVGHYGALGLFCLLCDVCEQVIHKVRRRLEVMSRKRIVRNETGKEMEGQKGQRRWFSLGCGSIWCLEDATSQLGVPGSRSWWNGCWVKRGSKVGGVVMSRVKIGEG